MGPFVNKFPPELLLLLHHPPLPVDRFYEDYSHRINVLLFDLEYQCRVAVAVPV